MSTVGLVSGVAAAGIGRDNILVTGIILIFVEAMSMAVGSFLTDQSVEEYQQHKEADVKKSIPGAVVMFISYLFSGIIPLFPYLLFSTNTAFILSIVFSIFSLFLLGYLNGVKAKIKPVKEGLKMALLGGLAILGGVIIGKIFIYRK